MAWLAGLCPDLVPKVTSTHRFEIVFKGWAKGTIVTGAGNPVLYEGRPWGGGMGSPQRKLRRIYR